MPKVPLSPALAALLFAMAAPCLANEGCLAKAASSARAAAGETLRGLDIAAPDDVIEPLVEEIAKEACDPSRRLSDATATAAVAGVARKFIENAEKLGRSASVRSLLAEATGGGIGLGRTDTRSFGSLTVNCPARLGTARVAFDGRNAGTCDSRFLLRAGPVEIAVTNGPSPVCSGRAEVRERGDRTCDCTAGATPATINCN